MGILPIRELARIPARDPAGFSVLPSPRLTGPSIKSNGKSKTCLASALRFSLLRAGRALGSSRGPHGLAAAAVDQAPQGAARGIAPIPLLHRMCNRRNPADAADRSGRMPERRKALGRVSLVPIFARAKKGTRSPKRVEALALKNQNSKNWIPASAGMTKKAKALFQTGNAVVFFTVRNANVDCTRTTPGN